MFKQEPLRLSNGKEITKPKSSSHYYIITLGLLIIFSAYITKVDLLVIFDKADKFWAMVGDMVLPPDFNFFDNVWPEMLATIRMSIVGTFWGALIGFPIAFLAARNINNNPISIVLIKAFLSITRTMPVLVYAMILTYIVGLGEFAGICAIVIFTFSIITKMTFEDLETLDMGGFEAAISQGATRIQATRLTIIPQMFRTYITYTLYCFEINVRSATIIGYVGAGGIGHLLNQMISLREYDKAGLILIMIMIAVIIIDNTSQLVRRRLA